MPRASAPPGAGLRKPAKVRRTSSSGRTAGERSIARTYKALPKPKRRSKYVPFYKSNIRNYGMAEGANPVFPPSERAFALDQAIYKYRERADMKPDSRELLAKEFDRLMKRLVETSPNLAKKIKKADPTVEWWKPVEDKGAWGTYRSDKNRIRIAQIPTETVARFGYRNPTAVDILRKVLLHELVHSTQKKRTVWTEPEAEIKARKAMRRAYGTSGYKAYSDAVRMFKRMGAGK